MTEKTVERLTAGLLAWLVLVVAMIATTIVVLSGEESYAATENYAQPHVPKTPEARAVPCVLEDGSGPTQQLPCYWDASVSGNGVGNSFWIDRAERTHYLSPRIDFIHQKSLRGWSRYRGVKGHGACVTKNYALACQDGYRAPI